MKVLFLDIDGVLNSVQSSMVHGQKSYDYEGLCRIGVGLLRKLCEVTGTKIVISSTWRSDGIEMIKGALATCGWRDIVFTKTVIGRTPQMRGCRGDEIQYWLEENPSCTNYVILDDDSDMLESQKDHFVKTDSLIGFNMYDAAKALEILGVDPGKEQVAKDWMHGVQFKIDKRAKGDHGYSI